MSIFLLSVQVFYFGHIIHSVDFIIIIFILSFFILGTLGILGILGIISILGVIANLGIYAIFHTNIISFINFFLFIFLQIFGTLNCILNIIIEANPRLFIRFLLKC